MLSELDIIVDTFSSYSLSIYLIFSTMESLTI
uniref:Uncharacterized protein n=1 Tax=virus sp. ctML55 TaxID=2827627 RepID=A0A8S5RI67_9VIRU|nr:MAG TPA: hypothetical protein [virus sp. ctML55]DAJ95599.1 MAG TPA: hypothetical protein [Caudoviricetes sp.]DAV59864.1 MAG TPA: hypothetical protein [Caudoviricetes sp.]DAW91963.1 MAG TPA: hypothetical protein [Bacteriophage sp.]